MTIVQAKQRETLRLNIKNSGVMRHIPRINTEVNLLNPSERNERGKISGFLRVNDILE